MRRAFGREHFLHDLDQLRSSGKAPGPELAFLEDHAGELALGVSLNQHEEADLHVSLLPPGHRGGVIAAGCRSGGLAHSAAWPG
jgi:hypothetical protein